MPDPVENKARFHAMHYNFTAKRLREAFDMSRMDDENGVTRVIQMTNHAVLCDLAVSFAVAYAKDNPSFDPLKFLDACSPDVDLYPFSEAWDSSLLDES
jgi:hypothetical protein